MSTRHVSRRTVLKRSLTGLLVFGPMAELITARPVFAAVCDTCNWEWVSQECVGPDLYDNWICVDPVYTNIVCRTEQDIYPSHPDCKQEDTEGEADANGLLWATELGYGGDSYGMLRARTSPFAPGGWEQFQLVHLSSDNPNSNNPSSLRYAFQSLANGLYVSAELGLDRPPDQVGMLRARAGAIGSWEQFQLAPLGGQLYAIQSLANGLFVSTELGYGGDNYAMLRARASAIGPWERHWIFRP